MYKVLLVDDEDIIKIGLRSIVDWEEQGFQIVGSADNGLQALEKVKELEPDVVLTDLIMPLMNGLDLIRGLKEMGYQGIVIVLSNYGDVKYVKEALRLGVEDYILKVSYSREEFIELLQRLSGLLGQRMDKNEEYVKLILDQGERMQKYLTNDEIFYSNEDSRINYQLFLVKLPESVNMLQNGQYTMLYQKIKNIFEEILKTKRDLVIFQVSRGVIVLNFQTGDERLHDDNIIPDKIRKTLSLYLMLNSTIIYKFNIEGTAALKQAFQSCKEKLRVQFYEEVCLPSSKVQLQTVNELINPIQISNRYRRLLREHEYEKIQNELQSIILNFQENWVDPIEVKDFLRQVVIAVQLYFDEIYHTEILKGICSAIKEADRIFKLNEIINNMIEELMEYKVIILDEKEDIEPVERMKKYVEDNISNKLSLNELAGYMNFHPNYMSNYFKQKTGITLSYYINSQKMKYAKSLVDKDRYRIKEISEQVGYEDPLYFSRCFKKYFGYSPSKREN